MLTLPKLIWLAAKAHFVYGLGDAWGKTVGGQSYSVGDRRLTTVTQTSDLSRFCSVCARQAGLDPAGQAHSYELVLGVELPLPWPETMYDTPGILPQELLDFRTLIIESYQRGEPIYKASFFLAPDPAYSQPGFRRVMAYRRPESAFASFEQEEYLIPEEECGPLCWALLAEPDSLPRFADYLQPASPVRDLMVCTHGAVDAACAKFGYPLYRYLRQIADHASTPVRVWRASHFGGHVFAPTILDMPEFRYWAYIDREQAKQIVERNCVTSDLYENYRGWAGFENPFLQVAERELFVRYGWEWINYLKQAEVLAQGSYEAEEAQGDKVTWLDAKIDFRSPDGAFQGCYQIRVEQHSYVETIHSSKNPATYRYPQYRVTSIEQLS